MRMQENGAAAGVVVKRSQEQRARECIIEKERVLKEGTHTPFLPSLQGREYARLCRHYRLSEMDKGTATRRGRHGASVSILVCKQACRRMCVCAYGERQREFREERDLPLTSRVTCGVARSRSLGHPSRGGDRVSAAATIGRPSLLLA